MLTVYDPAAGTHKNYVAATDRCLHESIDSNSPSLPPFHHETEDRGKDAHLNVFLVALNAAIQFHQYLEMVDSHPPTTPLPDRVLALMRRTIELVALLYWEPVPTKGSQSEKILSERFAKRRSQRKRAAGYDHADDTEKGPSEEIGVEMEQDEDTQDPTTFRTVLSRRMKRSLPEDVDLEAQMAYGRSIVCGYGALFFPLSSRVMHIEATRT